MARIFNNFLPCEIGALDEISDPMLSIQVTMFECGGFALGFCFSHRIVDVGAISPFIDHWTASSKEYGKNLTIFNALILFPPRNLPELDVRVPRKATGVESDRRMLLFNAQAISALRAKAGFEVSIQNKSSKVQLLIALLYKAMIGVEKEKNGGPNSLFLVIPANLSEKVEPPLPKQSFGNFWGLATTRFAAGEDDNLDFKGYVDLIRESVRKAVRDCKKILSQTKEGFGVVINPFLEAIDCLGDSEVNFYLYTSWGKFSFYEADFGWGKPVWASTAKLPFQNMVILFDGNDGDGIEAWVNLDEKDMKAFEEDSDMKDFAIY